MAAMRIILLASALASGHAAAAVHAQEMYSASGCEAADLVAVEYHVGGCHVNGEWQSITCNETHFQMTRYSGAQCTGAPIASDGTTIKIDSSACTQQGSRWTKIKCNAVLEQPLHFSYVSYKDEECATKESNDSHVLVLNSGCTPASDFEENAWKPKSQKVVYTPGEALSVTEYPSTDCSGTSTGNETYSCGECHKGNRVIVTCPNGAGSASSGRRSTPWAVATFGAAALAIVAAQHATA